MGYSGTIRKLVSVVAPTAAQRTEAEFRQREEDKLKNRGFPSARWYHVFRELSPSRRVESNQTLSERIVATQRSDPHSLLFLGDEPSQQLTSKHRVTRLNVV